MASRFTSRLLLVAPLLALGCNSIAGVFDLTIHAAPDAADDGAMPTTDASVDAPMPGDAARRPDAKGDDSAVPNDDTGSQDQGAGDGGCTDADIPDVLSATYYGSCSITVVSTDCDEYGTYTPPVSQTQAMGQAMICTQDLSGTWADGPCNLEHAVFGCATNACDGPFIEWFYAPGFSPSEAPSTCVDGQQIVMPP